MIQTLSLSELLKKTNNIYETIIIIAKRARQINEEQKKMLDTEINEEEPVDENYFEEDIDKIKLDRQKREPSTKPTTVALNEFLNGKLTYQYSPGTKE
jgi:DNA-directed RNA polymerase omega subunit